MFNWLRELYEIRADHLERLRHCRSCERLETELARTQQENHLLLSKLLPKDEVKQEIAHQPIMIPPKRIPFRVTQQSLEKKDRELAIQQREEAKTIAEFQKREAELKARSKDEPIQVVTDPQIEELEKALGLNEDLTAPFNTTSK